ncbi:DUF3243 domain-containing protein [Niallia taxi]|uniref:DUF3243 domain-containing protein n=1 Tax=Niallia taxi TaxID=2499688 RepID=A0A437KHR3_9BACI|nr:DUF3243 domain-containing protein [Niallia taxi]MCM3216039.1 DUF3243 domain-containing protein [Niallia taxi]MCT2342698.1 DUF3243 domain-containing protein [Niallia taxi]MDE5050951.1 DUF3243 domain-containing protein [Niallia taxi]MDK8639196.1 DUF3243 domain-containing protein [Niallia taxi]MED3962379.1 DUF3243 domain-containing protein [Niallia taxi]
MENKLESKVNDKLQNMDSEKKEEILSSFDGFKQYLADKVEKADKLGLDQEQIAKAAQKVGDFLAAKEEPRNREEKLLQELWKAGNEEEQHKLAHMLVKLVS